MTSITGKYLQQVKEIYKSDEPEFTIYFEQNVSLLRTLPEFYNLYLNGYQMDVIKSILIYINHYIKLPILIEKQEIKKNCIILYCCAILKNIIDNKDITCKNPSSVKNPPMVYNMIYARISNFDIDKLFVLLNDAWSNYLKTHSAIYLNDTYWITRTIVQKKNKLTPSDLNKILNKCHKNIEDCFKKYCLPAISEGGKKGTKKPKELNKQVK